MKRIIRLTESDLARIVRRVINEQNYNDSYVSALKQLVDNVNTMLPKGGYKLAFSGPTERTLSGCAKGKQYNSYVNVVKADGQPLGSTPVNLAMVSLMTNCNVEGQVGSSSMSFYGLAGNTTTNFAKNSQQKGGRAIPGDTIWNVASTYIKSGDKNLAQLGYALRGQVSTNAQGVKTDFSKIPPTLITGFNNILNSIETLVKTV